MMKYSDFAEIISNFETTDLPLAATLVSLGYSLITIERTNPKRAGFCFTLDPESHRVVENYHDGKILVEPRTYFDAIRHLKNRLYAG